MIPKPFSLISPKHSVHKLVDQPCYMALRKQHVHKMSGRNENVKMDVSRVGRQGRCWNIVGEISVCDALIPLLVYV